MRDKFPRHIWVELISLKACDMHDDFHPFIMNVFKPVVQTHFMLETRGAFQTHLVLEETNPCGER